MLLILCLLSSLIPRVLLLRFLNKSLFLLGSNLSLLSLTILFSESYDYAEVS